MDSTVMGSGCRIEGLGGCGVEGCLERFGLGGSGCRGLGSRVRI